MPVTTAATAASHLVSAGAMSSAWVVLTCTPRLAKASAAHWCVRGVVLATLLFNATTISFVVHVLGLDKPSRSDEYLNALARLLAVRESRNRLRELNFEDQVVSVHLDVAETDAEDLLARSNLDAAEQKSVLTLRGLHIERETYQSLSDAGLLPPIATGTLMEEIDPRSRRRRPGVCGWTRPAAPRCCGRPLAPVATEE
jgi:hypothetical protein